MERKTQLQNLCDAVMVLLVNTIKQEKETKAHRLRRGRNKTVFANGMITYLCRKLQRIDKKYSGNKK